MIKWFNRYWHHLVAHGHDMLIPFLLGADHASVALLLVTLALLLIVAAAQIILVPSN